MVFELCEPSTYLQCQRRTISGRPGQRVRLQQRCEKLRILLKTACSPERRVVCVQRLRCRSLSPHKISLFAVFERPTFKKLLDFRKSPIRWEAEHADCVCWRSTLPIVVVRNVQESRQVRLPQRVGVKCFG